MRNSEPSSIGRRRRERQGSLRPQIAFERTPTTELKRAIASEAIVDTMPEPHLGLLVDHLSAVGVASDPASAAQGVHDQIEMRAPQYAHHMIPLYALLLVNAAAPAVATGGPDKPSAAVRPAPSQTLQRLEAEVDQLVVDARHVTGDEKNALNVHLQNVKTLRTEARAQVAELSSARVDGAQQGQRAEAALHSLREALERAKVLVVR